MNQSHAPIYAIDILSTIFSLCCAHHLNIQRTFLPCRSQYSIRFFEYHIHPYSIYLGFINNKIRKTCGYVSSVSSFLTRLYSFVPRLRCFLQNSSSVVAVHKTGKFLSMSSQNQNISDPPHRAPNVYILKFKSYIVDFHFQVHQIVNSPAVKR